MRLAALALALAAPALAQPVSPNAEVLAAAHAFDDAQLHGDRATLERMLAPEYRVAHASGRIGDRREFIEGFAAPGHTLEPFQIVEPLFLRVAPDVAIVGGETTFKGTEGGTAFTQHYRYADTLVKRDGRWLVIYTQVTPLP
ncbi:ketosteroid isomerase-like protein [Sphingomonas vulcanisoli]|uniref:Ketosteroid isomerase-like protein n=1 Tax=Sphingomonas vulcanisoli TaxID=1658060 RepID=A0ABX0TQR0_9SPHN|nr:nuclear transport factor 2 family protein [Sphingomonas vulcanisoli]NIJ07064.1 ketosteroid isomerase-like protein [Sphingomonas vulcanisoli]